MSVQQSLAAMLVDVLRDNDNPHIGWLVSISNESKKNILVKLDLVHSIIVNFDIESHNFPSHKYSN